MKKILILICAAACVLSASCGGGSNELTFKNFKDSIGEKDGDKVHFAIASIDFPVKGDKQLVQAINNWISSFTQGQLEGEKYKKYVANVAKRIFDKPENDEFVYGGYENSLEICKLYDTTNIVTMSGLVYNYSGGAHGVHKSVAVTFRKSDGKMFSKEMISDYVNVDFKKLIKKHMLEYFDVKSDAELREQLFEEGLVTDPSGDWWVKLPGSFLPYIDKEGNVVVTYGLYEIAPYAAGEVEARIPQAEIMPYLTEDGKLFFE
ncbi:MAG: DUF3298 and DUF4163 domain-containing protein [Bacteroidales bacterium]|nr:DUF3298 and DUF4163 domain-containing protein [Bacteroidales bacterium]